MNTKNQSVSSRKLYYVLFRLNFSRAFYIPIFASFHHARQHKIHLTYFAPAFSDSFLIHPRLFIYSGSYYSSPTFATEISPRARILVMILPDDNCYLHDLTALGDSQYNTLLPPGRISLNFTCSGAYSRGEVSFVLAIIMFLRGSQKD